MRKLVALVLALALVAVQAMGQTVTNFGDVDVDSLDATTATLATATVTTGTISAATFTTLDAYGVTTLAGNTMTAGSSITTGALAFTPSAIKVGDIYYTSYFIDMTGLHGVEAGDVIGDSGDVTNAAHIGQITAARNGEIVYGQITCLETPAGGDPDVDLWYATVGTGKQSDAISGVTGKIQMVNNGDWTGAAETPVALVVPVANSYLYLVAGATTDLTYSAGQFLIELWGK